MAQTNEGFESEDCGRNGKQSVDSGDFDIQLCDIKKTKEDEILNDTKTPSSNCLAVGVATFWSNYNHIVSRNGKCIKRLSAVLLCVVFAVYIAAVVRQYITTDQLEVDWCRGYGMALIVFILLIWTMLYYILLVPFMFPYLAMCSENKVLRRFWRRSQNLFAVAFAVLLATFLIWDTTSNRRRLISIGGLMTFIVCGFVFSKHPTQVRWRTVFMGLAIQFMIGMLAIRWSGGRKAFNCVGNLTETFLEYSYVGAGMVYGDLLVNKEAVFAFRSLSAVFYVSMIVQVLFYLGWMQIVCLKLGWFIQKVMGTTVMESVNAVSSVFLGMTEAPLLYKPYIKDLTQSEMHAVMAGGFSTIAGTVFAAYTSFGVSAAHIITASIMTAPAALCYAKLVYPENAQSTTDSQTVGVYKSDDKSIMDAAIQGALVGISMVQGIVASVIACVSVVAFFNAVLAWIGSLAGIEDFTLETILAYLLYPVVFIMGVEPSQCLSVSRLIGVKISVNEFVAYQRFGTLKETKVLTPRTEAITTYALCSFANPGSIGIMISTLTTLCPSQRFNIIAVSFRAFCSAVVISFLTACIAGALMPEEGFAD